MLRKNISLRQSPLFLITPDSAPNTGFKVVNPSEIQTEHSDSPGITIKEIRTFLKSIEVVFDYDSIKGFSDMLEQAKDVAACKKATKSFRTGHFEITSEQVAKFIKLLAETYAKKNEDLAQDIMKTGIDNKDSWDLFAWFSYNKQKERVSGGVSLTSPSPRGSLTAYSGDYQISVGQNNVVGVMVKTQSQNGLDSFSVAEITSPKMWAAVLNLGEILLSGREFSAKILLPHNPMAQAVPVSATTSINPEVQFIQKDTTRFLAQFFFEGESENKIEKKLQAFDSMGLGYLAAFWCQNDTFIQDPSKASSVGKQIATLFSIDDWAENISVEELERTQGRLKGLFTGEIVDCKNGIERCVKALGEEVRDFLPQPQKRAYVIETYNDYIDSLLSEARNRDDQKKALESGESYTLEKEKFDQIRKEVGAPRCITSYILALMDYPQMIKDIPLLKEIDETVSMFIVFHNDLRSLPKEMRSARNEIKKRFEAGNIEEYQKRFGISEEAAADRIMTEEVAKIPRTNRVLINLQFDTTSDLIMDKLDRAIISLQEKVNRIMEELLTNLDQFDRLFPRFTSISTFYREYCLGSEEWHQGCARYTPDQKMHFEKFSVVYKRGKMSGNASPVFGHSRSGSVSANTYQDLLLV